VADAGARSIAVSAGLESLRAHGAGELRQHALPAAPGHVLLWHVCPLYVRPPRPTGTPVHCVVHFHSHAVRDACVRCVSMSSSI
jgi:hypothetical protein